ncbi:Hsp20/alpha crystallin family protein [Natronolimnohabitans sp. A-GB9]|uniref:Hsp20/alpha crystallin family protein n=1 Tax=Natronolimnohabitans sp. A-GB9 TaxID=3069757 RepID=UPI0027B1D3CA|nr:Hsp20/alpha crystallin family protein [Natronolimnohabitans sp. A-GB9]MDQ2051516.1 Hsp20/alpha crystallin family protein [Natronolimnohabitans sp. A-GB9]
MTDRRGTLDGLEELFERLNRQLETAARTWESELERRSQLDLSMGGVATRLDLADHGDAFVVTVDVPGYETDDLACRLRGQTLQISGERERTLEDETTEDGTYLRRERETRSFTREIDLPEPVDADDVTASVTNGILTVRLPKLEPTESARTIDIE